MQVISKRFYRLSMGVNVLIIRMKHIVVILFLLMLGLTTSAQSRILTGTVAAAPNVSTTILPHIVVAKTMEGQKEDSALFNPRYVPPPPVDSSNLNANTVATATGNASSQSQSGNVGVTNYQYKTPDSKPYVNGKSVLTPTATYQKPQQVEDGTEVYQYKTPDSKPIVGTGGYRFPKRIASKPNAALQQETVPSNGVVKDPLAVASTSNTNSITPKPVAKWVPKKTATKKPETSGGSVAANSYSTTGNATGNIVTPANGSFQSFQTITPSINKSVNSTTVTYSNSSPQNVVQRTDYKIEITTDGKFTVTFYNNGSSIVVTSFGRIANVSSPASSTSIAQQYDYRGLLQSVGGTPLQYTYEGRLQSVGSTNLSYNYNGNIQSIGNTSIYYNFNGTLDKIGNTKVLYDPNGSVSGTSGADGMITIKQ